MGDSDRSLGSDAFSILKDLKHKKKEYEANPTQFMMHEAQNQMNHQGSSNDITSKVKHMIKDELNKKFHHYFSMCHSYIPTLNVKQFS